MKDPYLLHIFSPTRHVSPFDVNMAYEARYDAVIPYAGVTLEDTVALTQDTIFSRGPKGVKRTGIFIGGREFGLAIDMLEAVRAAMVPPFEVSVFTDPSGAITTAAALIATVEYLVARQGGAGLQGRGLYIFGGTGPVGTCAALLAAQAGAAVHVVSHQGLGAAQKIADDCRRRFQVQLRGVDGSDAAAVAAICAEAEVIINTARAGVQVVNETQLAGARALIVAADANAVPPAGIAGVGVHDMGEPLPGAPAALGVGALAVGDVKYKVHTRLLQMMYEADEPLYLSHPEAFAVARELAGA